MDGVPYVTYPPIAANSTFVYKFPIRQAGTYWYHSHSGLQEQKGVYGQIVIHPKNPRRDVGRIDHDVPILFSDWTDESTHEVMKTLKRGSEYYSLKKGSSISLTEAAKYGMLGSFFSANSFGCRRWISPNPLRPRAFGGKGADGMKKEIPSSSPATASIRRRTSLVGQTGAENTRTSRDH